MNEKVQGYLKEGETMFVSTKFHHLSLVIDSGGDVLVGDRVIARKPRYIDFHPGFAGGELRVNKITAKRVGMSVDELLEHLRERDKKNEQFCEVLSVDHLADLVAAREVFVKDEGDGRVAQRGVPAAPSKPSQPAPAKVAPETPKAAKGPGRKAVSA